MILIDMKKLVIFIFMALFSFSAFAQKKLDFDRDSLLVNLPYGNVLNVLSSQVPGFSISPVDNAEGDMSATMTLRGMNRIPMSKSADDLAVNAPLIVLDGVPFIGSISEINTADVAKVEVLHDASALYGSRGLNGAILITTRKGKKSDGPHVRFNAGGSISGWSRRPEGVNQEWTDYISRKGIGQQYDLSVSGGSETMNYYVSGSYNRRQGILLGDNFERFNGTARIEMLPIEWAKLGFKLSYSGIKDWGVRPRIQNAFWMKEPSNKYSLVPGYEDWVNAHPDGLTPNPLLGDGVHESYLYTDRLAKRASVDGLVNLHMDFPFLEGLSFDGSFHANRFSRAVDSFTNPELWVDTDRAVDMANPANKGILAKGYSDDGDALSWHLRGALSYDRSFGPHNVNVHASLEKESYDSESLNVSFSGFDAPTNLGVYTLESAKSFLPVRRRFMFDIESRNAGAVYRFKDIARVSVEWRSEVLKSDTDIRIDYLNASAAWSALPDKLTIHGSYGTSRRDEVPYKDSKVNIGADYTLMPERMKGTLDFYYNRSSFDPVNIGMYLLSSNGETIVTNKGFELTLNSVNYSSPDLSWKTSACFALNRNKIEKLYGVEELTDAANAIAYGVDSYFMLGTGHPINGAYDFVLEGKDSNGLKFKDVVNDGQINEKDRDWIGDGDPLFVVNFGNTLSWKGLSVWFNLRWMAGGSGHFLGYDPGSLPDNNSTSLLYYNNWNSKVCLKLSDLVLSYKINRYATITVSGTNLLTISDWSGLDPESGGTIATSAFTDKFVSYPTFRTLRLGINLLF